MRVVYKQHAAINIAKVALYIAKKGYPETAQKYRKKIYEFGNSLADFSEKYPICRHAVYSKGNFHCAVFDRAWVFVYKIVKSDIVIYNVIHSSLLA